MSSAVASSSTLWAQASKEWIIPAKPKPGRKPKKDPTALPPLDEIAEPDSKGRRVQNRAAQRAFRERKQSQLADLQARVQLYEQGEMERNVALQNIAKRLKEENEILRKENAALREELRKLRPDRSSSVETERKRWREESLVPYSHADLTLRKRFKTDSLPDLSPDSLPPNSLSLMPSPASMASSPGSDSTSSSVPNDSYSPIPFSTRSPSSPMYPQTQQPPMSSLYSGFPGKHPACINENRTASSFDSPFDMVDCGFCSDDTPCMCRELALQHVVTRIAIHNEVPGTGPTIPTTSSSAGPMGAQSPPEIKMESRGSLSINSTPQMTPVPVPVAPMSSILDNLPAYSPPVPLPRRRTADHPPPSIFPVYPAQSLAANRSLRQNRSTSPNCTGDPSNCLACSDDPFGKAFCAALGSSIKECNSCPNNESAYDTGFVGCGGCGNPNLCGGAGSNLNTNLTQSSGALGGESNAQATSSNHMSSSTMSCNTAWAQLKSHPNIAFADLTLLANVVARRSKCTGPRVVLSPDPELDALRLSARQSGRNIDDRGPDDMSVLLTDPHAQYHDRPDSIISRPTEMMIQCGRQRVVEVDAEGVQDALALLDGQFQRS